MIDAHLTADIHGAEGCELTAYTDSEGFWTVGWGHLLGNAQSWAGHTVTQFQADAQCGLDIASAQAFASGLPEWHMMDTPCRKNALTELCFNLRGHWYAFHETRKALQTQNWQGAHDGLLHSLWASQVGVTRANRLANYFLTGQYP